METKVKYTGQLGFIDVLTLIFIVLKLVGVINWPWIWVLSPLWIALIMAFVIVGIILFVKGVDRS